MEDLSLKLEHDLTNFVKTFSRELTRQTGQRYQIGTLYYPDSWKKWQLSGPTREHSGRPTCELGNPFRTSTFIRYRDRETNHDFLCIFCPTGYLIEATLYITDKRRAYYRAFRELVNKHQVIILLHQIEDETGFYRSNRRFVPNKRSAHPKKK